jgi:alpha-amylase
MKRIRSMFGGLSVAPALVVAALTTGVLTTGGGAWAGSGETFVQLFEWSWADIAQECTDFLGPRGYAAVQISPPNEHVRGDEWWTRYQPVSYKLVSRSGDEAALKGMIDTCHAAGVKIIADAVINHTADRQSGSGVGGTPYSRKSHPTIPFGPEHYHPDCDIEPGDYYDRALDVFACELANLPDLNTGREDVRERIAGYLKDLSTRLKVDGLRVDAAKHMDPADLDAILDKAGNPFAFLEVIGAEGQIVQAGQYTGIAKVTDFKYGTDIAGKLRGDSGGRLSQLRTFGDSWGLVPSDRAVVFIDNHDRERGHGGGGNLSYKDGARYNLANVFMLAHPQGQPVVLSGYRFSNGDAGPPAGGGCSNPSWVCQHRWGNIANMVAYRRHTVGACREGGETSVDNWWADGRNRIAFGCADRGFVVINADGGRLTQRLQTGLPAGRYCNVLSNDDPCGGETVEVDAQGFATFNVAAMNASAIHGGARPGGTAPLLFAASLPSLFFRGTPNDWGTTRMTLVGDHLWEAQVQLDGRAGQRWKLDVTGDWSHNYGDNDSDGRLERTGRDIYTDAVGTFRVQVDDSALTYKLIGAAPPTTGGPAPATLGAVYSPERSSFSLWSPDTADVALWLDGATIPMERLPDRDGYTDVYGTTVAGDLRLKPYRFLVRGQEVRDPYARMVRPNSIDSIVMDLTATDLPGGWAPRPPLAEREDSAIYELHVRDFTIDPSSGVPESRRGKYLGLVERGTRNGAASTGLDHLLELGAEEALRRLLRRPALAPNDQRSREPHSQRIHSQ